MQDDRTFDGDAFEATLSREVTHVLEHLNDGHADAVTLIARYRGGCEDVADAEITGADRAGIRLAARRRDGSNVELRVGFEGRPDSLLATRGALFALLREARTVAGDAVPLTTLERELAQTEHLTTFVTQVTSAETLAPGLRRIVVGGGLDSFEPLGPDQFLYVMVPRERRDAVPIPPGFRMQELSQIPEDRRPYGAYYTVRRWDREQRSIEFWVVLHAHDATAGVSAWALHASPGDSLALWGPRSAFDPPAETRSLLLVGDETGLPAIAAILEAAQPGVRARVLLETSHIGHLVALPSRASVETDWVFRDARDAGTGTRLLDAVRALDLDPVGLYAFGAAEFGEIGAVRRHLRRDRGLAASQVRMVGYWRRLADGLG
jgi:NADPH-dependent ferric siderophore reductase